MPKKCLIYAMPQDVHSYAVGWAVQNLGVEVRYLYTSDLPERSSVRFATGLAGDLDLEFQCSRGWDSASDQWCSPSDFGSVWFRRSRKPVFRADLGAGDRQVAASDWNSVLPSVEMILEQTVDLCINPSMSKPGRALKCYHLWLAQREGLETPDTLVTNDPESIYAFLRRHGAKGGACIAKPLNLPSWGNDKDAPYVFTTALVTEGDLKDTDLRSSPVIMQPKVEKAFEVRVTKIGMDYIAVRLDSQLTEGGKLDFRAHTNWKDFGHERVTMPESVAKSLDKVCQKLNLIFCTVDFIVRPDGSWIFLEINHMGNWLWIELYNPQVRLLDRMAQLLVSGNAEFRYSTFNPVNSIETFMEHFEREKFGIAEVEAQFHPNNFEGLVVEDC